MTMIDIRTALRLYAITDARPADELPQAVQLALRGGATMIQLRRKHTSDEEFLRLAHEIKRVTDEHNVPLIINDRADIALQTGAAGVHLGPSDGGIAEARAMLGPQAIIGATARTIEQALTAEAAGADYLGSGAVFGTSTKFDATAMPLMLFRDICKAVRIPVVAIGGIDRTNIAQLRGCGMAGFAVVSGVFGGGDILQTTQELHSLAGRILQPRPLLFDLFSTLVSTKKVEHEHDPLWFSQSEWERHLTTECYRRRAIGLVTDHAEIIREILESQGIELSKAAQADLLHKRLERFRDTLCDVEPTILSTLRELKSRGHTLCLVSNADAIDIAHWKESPLAPLFDEAVFSCDCGHAKPAPEIYLHAATLLGVPPEECTFFGDNGQDELLGAKRLGMQTVQLRHFVSRDTAGADVVLDRFADILHHI